MPGLCDWNGPIRREFSGHHERMARASLRQVYGLLWSRPQRVYLVGFPGRSPSLAVPYWDLFPVDEASGVPLNFISGYMDANEGELRSLTYAESDKIARDVTRDGQRVRAVGVRGDFFREAY